MAGGESPSGGAEQTKSALEQFKEQVNGEGITPERKAELIQVMDEMKKAQKEDTEIITNVRTALGLIKLTEINEAKYQMPVLAVWKEVIADKQITIQENETLTQAVSKMGQAVLGDEIANGLTKDPSIYLIGQDKSVNNGRINIGFLDVNEFSVGREYTVNFGIGEENVDQDKARAAQAAVRLDHMFPLDRTGVTALHVESAKYGSKDLFRYPDGKFREAGKKVSDRHFPIFQGDSVKVLARGQENEFTMVEEEQPKSAQEIFSEKQKADAKARTESMQESALQRDQDALKRALGEAEDSEALVRGSKVKIPEEFGKLNRAVMEQDLIHFDNGEQVLSSLKTFSRLNGSKQPMQIMQELVDFKQIRFQEITRSVYGKSPMKLREEFDVSRNDVKVINFAEKDIARIMGEHPEYATLDKGVASGKIVEEVKKDMLASGDFKPEDVSRFYMYIEELLPANMVPAEQRGKHNLGELRRKVDDFKSFYVASERFMKGVGALEASQASEVAYESYEKDANMESIEDVTRDIFNPDAGYPEIRQTWLQSVFGPEQSATLNMMNLDQDFLRKNRPAYEAAVSGKSGYELLRNTGSSFNEKGVETGDLEKFAKKLQELRRQGWEYIQFNESLRTKYIENYDNLAPITKENFDDLSQQDIDLIQYGAIVEQTEVYIHEKAAVEAFEKAQKGEVISSYPEAVQEMLRGIDAEGKFSAEQLHQIGENIKKIDLGMLGIIYKQINTLQEGEVIDVERTLGASYTKPFTLLETDDGTVVTLGIGVQNNVIKHTFGVHAGLGAETKVGDRVHVGGGIGVASNGENIGGGISGSVSIDLGKYKTTSIGVTGGLDFAGLGFALGINVSRDLNAVVDKKADKIAEEQEAYINAGLDHYLQGAYFNNMTPEQKAEYKNAMATLCLREIHNQAVDNLKDIQFLGAGLMVTHIPGTPLTVPIPWIKIGIKGKEVIHYSRPDDMPELSSVGDAYIAKKLAGQTGVEVKPLYISGKLSLTEEGEKTISDSETQQMGTGNLEALNAGLAKQGIEVQNINGELRLKVKRVDGMVNLFTDPNSGIEAYTKGGYTYINLDRSDHLTLRRVDTYYPVPYFGHTHYVNLYLSNNIGIDGTEIEKNSKDKITWKQSDREEKQLSADRKDRTTENVGSANFDTRQDMAEQDIALGNFLDAGSVAEQQAALKEIRQAMASESADTINLGEIRDIAGGMITSLKIDYVRLTTDEGYTQEMITTAGERLKRPLNNHESTYLIQELLVRSRAKAPESPAKFAEHVLGWNQVALTNSLIKSGVTPEMAGAIAQKVMTKYGSIIISLESGADVKKTSVSEASIVHTLIGKKADGRMGEFITGEGAEAVSIVGMANLNKKQLVETFGLTAEEADAFLKAEMGALAPRDTAKPSEFMHTELGLAVFEASPILFGPEKARQLIALSHMKSSTEITTQDQAKAWTEYATLVNNLRTQKQVELNGMILTLDRSTKMGFLEACRNFTTTLHEGLAILLPAPVESISAVAIDYLESIHGVEFYGAGVAGTMSIRDKKIPPPGKEPKTTDPNEGGDVEHQEEADEGDEDQTPGTSQNSPRGQ